MKVIKNCILSIGSLLILGCNNLKVRSIDEKFTGQWVYVQNIPDEVKNDHTMDGAITAITKLEGTTATYNVKFWTGDMGGVFTVENDSTLKAIDANIRFRYINDSEHLFLELKPGTGIVWSKLK